MSTIVGWCRQIQTSPGPEEGADIDKLRSAGLSEGMWGGECCTASLSQLLVAAACTATPSFVWRIDLTCTAMTTDTNCIQTRMLYVLFFFFRTPFERNKSAIRVSIFLWLGKLSPGTCVITVIVQEIIFTRTEINL